MDILLTLKDTVTLGRVSLLQLSTDICTASRLEAGDSADKSLSLGPAILSLHQSQCSVQF